jgi:MOSC domain-containing protein YiiM
MRHSSSRVSSISSLATKPSSNTHPFARQVATSSSRARRVRMRKCCSTKARRRYRHLVAVVIAVHRNVQHALGKHSQDRIRLLAGIGVEGDAHAGATVQHRSRVKRDPSQPNLRQIHLIADELHTELRGRGFAVAAGAMGENVTTRGLDLLALPAGTRLHLGPAAVVEITGLRNPCTQLDSLEAGLMAATLDRTDDGTLLRRAGVMAIVTTGGEVAPGDPIAVELPALPHVPLEPV